MMSLNRSATTRYQALDASRRALARAAPLVRFGLFAVGVSMFLDQVRPLVSDGQFTWGERRVMGLVAIITLGSFGLAGWLAGTLLRAGADLIEVFVDGADAAVRSAYLIEAQLVPSLNRAAAAMERLVDSSLSPSPSSSPVVDLRARLEAARAADDLGQVIDCRDALTQYLRGEALHDLDRRVVRWLASRINARAKLGPVTPELVTLAERAGESFGDTPEGVALLDAVPDLRRRAGLAPATRTSTSTSTSTSQQS